MNYDFDKIVNRKGTGSIKWEKADAGREDVIPMGIADMDFETAPSVTAAIKERLHHPIFGYFELDSRYYDAIIKWHKEQFCNNSMKAENILYQSGTIGAVATAIRAFTNPGDYILCNAPVYSGFLHAISDNGRFLCTSPLKKDEKGIFRLDLEDMEDKIKANDVRAYIFCSPHNPTGRVWEREEIRQVAELCRKHHVFLISDEVWADIIPSGKKHIPTALVSEDAKEYSISVYAPSKTFNLAAMRCAYAVIYDPWVWRVMDRMTDQTHYSNPNPLATEALIGGYTGGAEWVKELNSYIRKNQEYICSYIKKNGISVKTELPEGTYLMWLDCSQSEDFTGIMKKMEQSGVLAKDGKNYLLEKHIRLNVACPFAMCQEAMRRMERDVFHV